MTDEQPDSSMVDEHAEVLTPPRRGRPEGLTVHQADIEAKRRWGGLGVAYIGQLRKVGKYDRSPALSSAPWPITVYGEGETFEEAFAQADEGGW